MVNTSSISVQPNKNFHKSIRMLILIGNILGLLPVNGVTSDSVQDLNFRWICPKTIYTLTLISIAISETVFTALALLQRGISPFTLLVFTVPLNWLLILIAQLHLARKWPQLIKKWITLEMAMRRTYKYPSSLDTTCKRLTGLFMAALTAFLVTVLSRKILLNIPSVKGLINYSLRTIVAINGKNSTIISNSAIISGVSEMIICFYAYVVNTLLVIAISTSVALRFRQITARLRKYGMQTHSLVFWCDIRADYIRLCRLCRLINEHISIQITMGFVYNFWFILVHVFRLVSIKERLKTQQPSYLTLAVHIVQIFFIGLYTAWVNDESKKPLDILNSVPSANYNNTIKMFVHHISFDTVALRGYKFFRCRRGLLLTIAGAVVTYELLLMQFTDYISR